MHQTTWPRQRERFGTEVRNTHAEYHTVFPSYYIFPGIVERCNKQNLSSLLKSIRFMYVLCSHCKCTPWICWRSWLHEHSLTYFSQNKLVSRDLLFKLSTLKHLILTESRFAVLLTDPAGQQPAAARQRLHGILFHQYSQIWKRTSQQLTLADINTTAVSSHHRDSCKRTNPLNILVQC